MLGTSQPKAKKPKVDCFYVYPTVSDDQRRNSDLSIDPEERSIALYQAARYSQRCRVFAPMYRQITLQALFSGPGDRGGERARLRRRARAWKTYLRKYNDGRGVVLLGHSQGTIVLRQLIAQQVDDRPGVRKRLVAAYLFGGNVEVKEGKLVGGDFKHIPGCESAKQIGCAIGFSTFNAPVPADSNFGRVGGRSRPAGWRPATSSAPTPPRSAAAPARSTRSFPASVSRPGRRSGSRPRRSGSPGRR